MQNQLNQNTYKEDNIIMGILRPSPTKEELKKRIPLTEQQLQAIKNMHKEHEKAYKTIKAQHKNAEPVQLVRSTIKGVLRLLRHTR
jgi:hypothetical protein